MCVIKIYMVIEAMRRKQRVPEWTVEVEPLRTHRSRKPGRCPGEEAKNGQLISPERNLSKRNSEPYSALLLMKGF